MSRESSIIQEALKIGRACEYAKEMGTLAAEGSSLADKKANDIVRGMRGEFFAQADAKDDRAEVIKILAKSLVSDADAGKMSEFSRIILNSLAADAYGKEKEKGLIALCKEIQDQLPKGYEMPAPREDAALTKRAEEHGKKQGLGKLECARWLDIKKGGKVIDSHGVAYFEKK